MAARTIIVTGASRGLGAAAALIAARMGANVVLNARSEGDLAAVAASIHSAGGSGLPIPGDVSQPEACRQLVARAVEQFGHLDAIINNAGVIEPIAPIADTDPRAWHENWAINLLGPAMLVQAGLPFLRQRFGRVINVSSGAAVNAIPGWAAYCTAKAALNHFTRVLADEERQITAISLRPGAVDTAMQVTIRRRGAGVMHAAWYDRFVRYHADGALLPPESPAQAAAVLALHAPHEWSGRFIPWSDDQVQELVNQYAEPG